MKKLVGLLTLLAALGVFAVAATGASADEVVVEEVPLENGLTEAILENGGTIVYGPIDSFEVGQQRGKGECSTYTVCVWENPNFTGNFSWWNEFPKGCKSHESNPKLRSGWNRTGSTVQVGGTGIYLYYNEGFETAVNSPVTGQICW